MMKPRIKSYQDFLQCLSWLQENVIKPGLERMALACGLLGSPEKQFRSVHIAGTNGKGSTAVFLESIVRNNGYRVGLYTSPHLLDVGERIQIDRKQISKEDIVAYARMVQDVCKDIDLSYFEFLTLIAFLYFAEQKVDIAVVEVGLGGRWDATNVLTPLVVVLTPISIDHTSLLGEDVLSIAKEKCGIIKSSVPVVISSQTPEVGKLIEKICDKMGSDLVVQTCNGCHDIQPSLCGKHQLANASLAIRVAEELNSFGYKIKFNRKYLNVSWPGRLQKIADNPEIIIDGAHNEAGCCALVDYISEIRDGREVVIIFGAMKDKKLDKMIGVLKTVASAWVVFQLAGARAADAKELREIIGKGQVKSAHDSKEAVCQAKSFDFRNPLIVVTGSLYLVAEFF